MGPPPSRCRRSAGAWLVLAGVLGALGPSAEASPPGPGVLGLAEDGRVGVFVVSGPYEARKPTGAPATSTGAKLALGDRPSGMPPLALSEALVCAGGDPDPCSRRTTVEIARSGVVDLKERLAPRGEALAYATFTLRTERDFRGFLLLSVDDGVRVSVDGKVIHSRDEGRPPRDDDDAVPLSLSAGRHVVSLELHQHDGPWQVAARIVGIRGLAPYTLTDLVSDTIGLLDTLKIRKAHFVGVSMGGMIGQLLAGTHQNRVLSTTAAGAGSPSP